MIRNKQYKTLPHSRAQAGAIVAKARVGAYPVAVYVDYSVCNFHK